MEAPQQKQMTDEQQKVVLRYAEVGLQWIAGKISFDEVIRAIGSPERHFENTVKTEYSWYPDDLVTVNCVFEKSKLADGEPRISRFNLTMDDDMHTRIPWERFERMGLEPLEHDKVLWDGQVEAGKFFFPIGIVDALGGLPPNLVNLGFRFPMPADSPFKVGAALDYLGEWIGENPPKVESNFRHTGDLREIRIGRRYLTPDEVQQRYHAAPLKFDEQKAKAGQ